MAARITPPFDASREPPHARHDLFTEAEDAARSPWAEAFGRFGYVTRGVLYCAMSVLIARTAFGMRTLEADPLGSLRALAMQPLGRFHLAAVACGLIAYATWRVAQAVLDPDDHGRAPKALALRATFALTGIFYVPLAVAALRMLAGARSHAGQSSFDDGASRLLATPSGPLVVGAIGVTLVVVGLVELGIAAAATFRAEMDLARMGRAARAVVVALGSVGFAAHGSTLALVGAFLVDAALRAEPSRAVGIDGALNRIARHAHGEVVVLAIGVGMAAFGAFSLLMARYRRWPRRHAHG